MVLCNILGPALLKDIEIVDHDSTVIRVEPDDNGLHTDSCMTEVLIY